MKKLLHPLLSAALVQLLFSCVPQYYSPNAHNVPLFTHSGETMVTVATGGGDEVDGSVELQAATAVTDHWALMTNFYSAWGSEPQDGSGSGHLFEVGTGYYRPFGASDFKSMKAGFVFSAFGGGGFGRVTNYCGPGKVNATKLGFRRVFVQPALGFKSSVFDVALSLRLARLSYVPVGGRWSQTPGNDPGQAAGLAASPFSANYFLLEPALTVRFGWQHVKLQTQLGLSLNQTDPEFYQENFNLNLGLCLDLFPDKKKAKE
jgi:hypothetical protein